MQISPTLLEILLLLIVSCSAYIWAKYGRKIIHRWKDLHRKRQTAGQLKTRFPEAVRNAPMAFFACHADPDEMINQKHSRSKTMCCKGVRVDCCRGQEQAHHCHLADENTPTW